MKANPVLPAEDPLYPSSDGLPLAENDFDPPLQGLVLRGGAYRALPTLLDSGARTIRSEVLGLDVSVANHALRFRDPATGEYLHNLAAAQARIAELEARLGER